MLRPPETTLLIYAEQGGPRFSYIVTLLFGENATITHREDFFSQFTGPRLQYTVEKKFSDPLHIQPKGLVFETDIHPVSIECSRWEEYPIFFAGSGDIPFDIFSAAFYLVARYEEYLPFSPDRYGRYPHTASVAYQQGFLGIPLVQFWAKMVKNKLGISEQPSQFTKPCFVPSYDGDVLFKYKYQSALHTMRLAAAHLFRFQAAALSNQIQVIRGKLPDPYENWQLLWDTLAETGRKSIFFFSANTHQRGKDQQPSIRLAAVQKIMHACSQHGKLGWHPSLQGSVNFSTMQQELGLLQTTMQQTIADVRFHYLRFQLPASYQWLLQLGIEREYSMGYGGVNGFRASYADSFPWFDLERNQATNLLIHPFCYMDTTAIYHQRCSPEEAISQLLALQKSTCGVVKELMLIFHPHCLASHEWRRVHDSLLLSNLQLT